MRFSFASLHMSVTEELAPLAPSRRSHTPASAAGGWYESGSSVSPRPGRAVPVRLCVVSNQPGFRVRGACQAVRVDGFIDPIPDTVPWDRLLWHGCGNNGQPLGGSRLDLTRTLGIAGTS